MLREMIAIGLGRGNELADLTLNLSNVRVEPEEDPGESDPWILVGDYVAVTVKGPGTWADEGSALQPRARRRNSGRGVRLYTRDLGAEGSVTVLLHRLEPGS